MRDSIGRLSKKGARDELRSLVFGWALGVAGVSTLRRLDRFVWASRGQCSCSVGGGTRDGDDEEVIDDNRGGEGGLDSCSIASFSASAARKRARNVKPASFMMSIVEAGSLRCVLQARYDSKKCLEDLLGYVKQIQK